MDVYADTFDKFRINYASMSSQTMSQPYSYTAQNSETGATIMVSCLNHGWVRGYPMYKVSDTAEGNFTTSISEETTGEVFWAAYKKAIVDQFKYYLEHLEQYRTWEDQRNQPQTVEQ